jgi:predicted site-specific integrase-resolvase
MVSPVTVFINKVAEEDGVNYHTVKDVAEQTGRSIKTIKRWIENGYVAPASKQIVQGKMLVYLYTDEDLARFVEFSNTMTPGRRMDLE